MSVSALAQPVLLFYYMRSDAHVSRYVLSSYLRTAAEGCNTVVMAKDKAAVRLGRKGGKATAKKLTPEQRRESARKAAKARWAKQKKAKK